MSSLCSWIGSLRPSTPAKMSDFDHISRLPDPILHQILSLLPTTRAAVRTSTLSKRWRDLYLSVSSLRLCLEVDFRLKRVAKRHGLAYDAERLQLFLGRMLQHLESSSIQMQTLRLGLYRVGELDQPLFARCLLVAAKRRVQHLHLSSYPGKILPWVSASQSLVKLSLSSCKISAEDLNTTCLPRLRALKISQMHFGKMHFGKSSAAKLFSGCPALRHLKIMDCSIDGDLVVSSHMLHTLNLIRISSSGVVSVSASALLSFHLNLRMARGLWMGRGCTMRGLSSLVGVYIDDLPANVSLDIFEGLHNVQELKLGPRALEIFFGKIISQGQWPTFSRLKKLELNTCLSSGPFQAITSIVQCFPNLEELVITKCEYNRFDRKPFVLSEPSEDFLGNLKLVKLHGFPSSNRSGETTKGFINSCLSNAKGPEKKLIAKLFEVMFCNSEYLFALQS